MAQAGRFPTMSAAPMPVIKAAHYTLIAKLIETGEADRIVGVADHIDIRDRAEHLRDVLSAVGTYVDAILDDTSYNAPLGTLSPSKVKDLVNGFKDLVSDTIGTLNTASIDLEAA